MFQIRKKTMTYPIKKFFTKEELQELETIAMEAREREECEIKERERKEDVCKERMYYYSSSTKTYEEKEVEKAQRGFVRVKSKGVNDIRFITDDGSIINLPILKATWNIETDEIPTITVVFAAEVDLDGCDIRVMKGKKTVPIEEFINQKKGD